MYSLIVPVYKNESSIKELISRVERISEQVSEGFEAIFVVDGSPDRSYFLLKKMLPEAMFSSQLVGLSKNFGSFAAIREGLRVANGEYFTVMAADLQEPPEFVITSFNKLAKQQCDITIGTRTKRDDPWHVYFLSRIFWRLYRVLVQPEIPPGGVDVFGCNSSVRDALLRMHETNTSLVGQLFWVGFRREFIPYQRLARLKGLSSWSLRRRFKYLTDSVFAFSSLPLSLLVTMGALGICGCFFLAILVLVFYFQGAIEVTGYAPLILMMLLTLATNLFTSGLVGAYVWRTFENSKNRPLALTQEHLVFKGNQ